MPTYDFTPTIKTLITAASWTPEFAGVHYFNDVSQDGFIANIILHSDRDYGVKLESLTERPEIPMTVETVNDWIAVVLLTHKV